MKIHNFSAGPSILPQSVFDEAAEAVKDFHASGLSILEISHRSAAFAEVLDESEALVRELFHLPGNFKPLFLTGGASSQFFMTAMNLLNQDEKAGYIDTGSWSSKAIKEAKNFGKIHVLASSKAQHYTCIPKEYEIPDDLIYLHLTSNNTIFGTQFHHMPDTATPLVSDMSSDIFSREIDFERFAVVYAGAQKNMGPAGVTLVIVNEELLGRVNRAIPTMLDYRTHIKKHSAFNTPPVFPIYVSMLNMRWLKKSGGIKWAAERSDHKARTIYDEIDRNPLFTGTAAVEDRSKMNATFVLHDEKLNNPFLSLCEEAGISGIKGHRSVGGFRASMYNAMEINSIELLVEIMQHFEKTYG